MRYGTTQPVRATLWLLAGMLLLASSALAVEGFYYRVQPGEDIDGVARRFRVSAYEIAKANRISVNSRLVGGSQIYVPASPRPRAPRQAAAAIEAPVSRSVPKATRPGQVRVEKGDSLWRIAQRHDVTVADLARANGLRQDAGLQVGQVLRLPGATTEAPARREPAVEQPRSSSPPLAGGTSSTGVSSRGFSWPVEGVVRRGYESSSTRKHFGINIATPVGTEVRAARDGTVVYAGSSITAYGNMVIINHDGGFASCYAFNDRNLVRVNQRINRGDVIALSGDSGKGDEPYVHFQLRRNGDAIDPAPYLP